MSSPFRPKPKPHRSRLAIAQSSFHGPVMLVALAALFYGLTGPFGPSVPSLPPLPNPLPAEKALPDVEAVAVSPAPPPSASETGSEVQAQEQPHHALFQTGGQTFGVLSANTSQRVGLKAGGEKPRRAQSGQSRRSAAGPPQEKHRASKGHAHGPKPGRHAAKGGGGHGKQTIRKAVGKRSAGLGAAGPSAQAKSRTHPGPRSKHLEKPRRGHQAKRRGSPSGHPVRARGHH